MALEFCSENCGVVSPVSPRISFSHDFSHSDVIPVEQLPFRSDSSGLNSSIDFDFHVSESFELEYSSADELFSEGRILPTQVKRKKNVPLKQKGQLPPHPLPPPSRDTSKILKKQQEISKESKYLNDEVYCKQTSSSSSSSKSFWSFKRSSSCGNGYRRSFCPLPLLSRSNSTGSVNKRNNPISKEGTPNNKQNSQKNSSSSRLSNSFGYQKPPLNKSTTHGLYGNNNNNSVRVNPVLNVPSANLFGLGSIFSNNRDKSKKK